MLSLIKKLFIPQFDLIDTKTSDFEIIKELFIDGVNNGNYEKNIIRDQAQFHNMVKNMTYGLPGYDIHGRTAVTLACSIYEKETIGFMTLTIDSANKEIEIWYFSILPKYRHSGNGTKYMEVLFKMINRKFPNYSLMARCKEKSKEMTKILHNFNFKAVSVNKEDYVIYKLAKVFS